MDRIKHRWRIPFAKHIKLLIDHTDVFMRGRGRCNHFIRMEQELMRDTIFLQKSLEKYHSKYCRWIQQNISTPERFI
ncbi:uncharacterized protein METZ01_LOCUS222422 [marine metagenome]|uniref:Uncharacterized protein n=1 Tax=marine metagenome TaxID=408172 RepID=A0A382G2S8_9ZZZZ